MCIEHSYLFRCGSFINPSGMALCGWMFDTATPSLSFLSGELLVPMQRTLSIPAVEKFFLSQDHFLGDLYPLPSSSFFFACTSVSYLEVWEPKKTPFRVLPSPNERFSVSSTLFLLYFSKEGRFRVIFPEDLNALSHDKSPLQLEMIPPP